MTEWYERAYPGGPMVGPPLKRPLYPPDAKSQGKTPSPDGDDVVAIEAGAMARGQMAAPPRQASTAPSRTASRTARAATSATRPRGLPAAAVKLQPTGWLGEATYNALRSARIPEGLPNAGQPLLDQTAIDLLNGYKVPSDKSPRQIALDHLAARVGYTESPPDSNCDSRSDGIRTAQDRTAGGGHLASL